MTPMKTYILRTKACAAADRPIFLVLDDGDDQVHADPESPGPWGHLLKLQLD